MSSQFDIGDQVAFYGGEGNVIAVEGQNLQVLTTDGSIRNISSDLPMVRKLEEAEEGDYVEFLGGRAYVVSVQERKNRPDLLYLRTEDDNLKKVPADLAGIEPGRSIPNRLAAGEFDDPVRFSLRERAVRLSLAYRSNRFLSLSGNRIRIEPYQVDAAHRILTAYEPRFMIADEVGLGKTIEAGIVIEELIARDRADRVLIITPASLRDQWQREMKTKFGREYVTYDRGYVDTLHKAHPGTNVWTHEDKIVVSIDFAKQKDMLNDLRKLEEHWDIVVFDEAHHLTARETSDGIDRVARYRVAEAVAGDTDALLFLTGTPHKGKPDQFFHLLRLLDPYRFRGPADITPEELENLMIRRTKTDESMIASDGTPMFPSREITTLPVTLTVAERQLYDDLTEYISAVYTANAESDRHAAGFTMVIYQKRLVSSIRAIAQSLQNRLDDLDEKTAVEKDISSRLQTVDDTVETEADVLEQLIAAANNIGVDSKGQRLREFIDRVLTEDSSEKILLFTEYTDTLEYLRDEVLSGYSTVEISGQMDQEARREAIKTFREDANILLATDAAREGLNLQFAHIMVNYDLPWNPIRIDQRMGRLHRYGQEQTVQIYNLFVKDTRESDILQLLVDKIDQIESDIGMRSDVLGTILDDYDVEAAIMDAVTGERSSNAVKQEIEAAVEERKEAVEKIEREFLIRDKFDAEDHEAIENIIDLSEEKPISEDDIEQLVREFCIEFGGRVVSSRPASDSSSPLLQLDVPDIISMNTEVEERYQNVTFSRTVALGEPNAELISLNHPLVQSITEYCLDGDWIDGKVAALVAQNPSIAPGILATFRLGYVSGDGEVPTEDYTHVYIDVQGKVHVDPPSIVGVLPAQPANTGLKTDEIARSASEFLDQARQEATIAVEGLIDGVRDERAQEVEVKEQHAKRYFQHQIRKYEDRLRKYEKDAVDTEKDMQVAIDSTRAEIRKLEEEWSQEQERLDRERQIIPDEPELVNAAFVTGSVPALEAQDISSLSDIPDAIEDGSSHLTFVSSHAAIGDVGDLKSAARLFRPSGWATSLDGFESIAVGEYEVWCASSQASLPDGDSLTEFKKRLSEHLQSFDSDVSVGLCSTDQAVDAVLRDGELLCNVQLFQVVPDAYWQVILARELVYADQSIPAERRYERIQRLLT
ncbi:SNF2-related protein [Haladaptatus sp. AB618]|uniref:helicase-related protein n=1 Tax=Haladaptatus sp. AB618 TaxID=2934173 RepID=UPI00209C1A55|nr:helicase-related protein [Haladaptatus sp. AB618]MCO8256750.1 SNF2-related protein [Haladaptatus sp. AB618]